MAGNEQARLGDDEDLLTVREVARRLRTDETTVRRWVKKGAMEAVTLPHLGKRQAYRIKKREVRKFWPEFE
jgi:excisionase family DNA binding protein